MHKNLGPKKEDDTPLKVRDENGDFVSDDGYGTNKWKNNSEKKINPLDGKNDNKTRDFDDEFLGKAKEYKE